MTFAKLIGNEQAKANLIKLATQEKDSHVLLFSGLPGVGKKSFALAFSSLLLGEKHAAKIQGKIHPDIIWLKPEGKLHLHPISSIKQMIDEAPLPPFEAKKKIYVIEEADRMLPASSNALLKLLEEPPSHIGFILLTSNEEGILPTLLSRCSKVSFYPIEENLITAALEEKNVPSETIKSIVASCKGSLSLALKLSSEEKDPIRLHFLQIVRHFFLQRPSPGMVEGLELLDNLIEEKTGEEEGSSQIT
ncbi:MAG: AAA family ATPase, partial [Verrucomicrobia bacterium]|nr:AAA family ATPase [Verrucomicrobiota bacterium]